MKILILANCQGMALERLFALISDGDSPAFEVIVCPPTYTWDDGFFETLMSHLKKCDILLYQPHTGQSWTKEWKTSSFWVKETSAQHVVGFPSLYFSGYSPELTYVRCPNGSHLNEGFCDYHDIRIIKSFCAGASETEAVSALLRYRLSSSDVLAYAEKSLSELARRESEDDLDIRVSEYVREHYKERRLFYTFNHPSNEILFLVVQELLLLIGAGHLKLVDPGGELLKFDYLPVMQDVHNAMELKFTEDPVDIYIQTVKLSRAELVSKYYGIYSNNRDLIESFLQAYESSGEDIFRYSVGNDSMNENGIVEQLKVTKTDAELRLYDLTLSNPDFTRYKCDPQTLSFMSDISFQLRRLYPEIQPGIKDVLDVGARTAVGSWFIKTMHHPDSFSAVRMNVTAVDIEEKYRDYASVFFPEVDYLVGDIFDLPEKSRDIVICSHTIEHVPRPRMFIEKLCQIAREYVVIACPFQEPRPLIPGHLHSINKAFIDQFNYEFLEVYTSMHWHQSKACIFAINAAENCLRPGV